MREILLVGYLRSQGNTPLDQCIEDYPFGVVNKRMQKLWKSKLPQKLKVFNWLASQERLQTWVNLKRRKWKGDEKCCLCGVAEDMNHIFFQCRIAKMVWFCIKEALGWGQIAQKLPGGFWRGDSIGGSGLSH